MRGAIGASPSFTAAALADRLERPVVLIHAHVEDAQHAADELETLGMGYVFTISTPGQQTFPPPAENLAFLLPDDSLIWLLPPPSGQGGTSPAPLPGVTPDPADPDDAAGDGGDDSGGG